QHDDSFDEAFPLERFGPEVDLVPVDQLSGLGGGGSGLGLGGTSLCGLGQQRLNLFGEGFPIHHDTFSSCCFSTSAITSLCVETNNFRSLGSARYQIFSRVTTSTRCFFSMLVAIFHRASSVFL